jgi:two-component system response regulator AtoC
MRVLIVDDEKNIRESLKKYLSLEKIEAAGAESAEEGLDLLEKESFDAVILDLKLPGMSGLEALDKIQQRGILSPVIMISAHGQIADAVAALKAGARDYLVKPFDPAELIIKLRSLVENRRRENVIEAVKRSGPTSALIGENPAMKRLSEQIDRIAGADVTVLITGESGTGKEVAAREIHSRSPNAAEPFAAVNIGGIHEGLMESELFGHEKGSFTGAASRKQGLFEFAGRGTIFLDEIGEMPMALQVKLLRVLQEKKIRRLGGNGDIPVMARIISATNQNLETLIKEGRFREDLYYRLNVFRIILPPLRERKEDIPLLSDYLLEKLCRRMGRARPAFAEGVLEKISAYTYPGNVRELENTLERALIYCTGNIIKEDDIDLHRREFAPAAANGFAPPANENLSFEERLPSAASQAEDPSAFSMDDIEKKAILDALERCNGNRTKAAELLGISRKTILNKLRIWGL